MSRVFAIAAAFVSLSILSACGTSVDRPGMKDVDQPDVVGAVPESPTHHLSGPHQISLRDIRGLDALREVARTVQAQHSYTGLALALDVNPGGTVVECRVVENPGQGIRSEVLTDDDRSSLCDAARQLRFPASDEAFEYRLNIGPPHLR